MTFTPLFMLAVSVLAAATDAAAQPIATFVMADLGTLGGSVSQIVDVNRHDQVAGNSALPGDAASHAFLWTATTGMIDLGTLGGTRSETFDLNESGQVIGRSTLAGDSVWHGFLWTPAAGMQDLSVSIGGATTIIPLGFNDNGQFIGSMTVQQGFGSHPFLWSAKEGLVDLGTLGVSYGVAAAVNGSGQVVGTDLRDQSTFHAFSWTAGQGMVDVGAIVTGAIGHFTESYAGSVNGSGQLLGWFFDGGSSFGPTRAFVWSSKEQTLDVPSPLGGGVWVTPSALSENGQMVGGASSNGWFVPHGFRWTRGGGTVDLGTLGGAESWSSGVSEGGRVVGYSSIPGAGLFPTYHAFVWAADTGIADLGALGSAHNSAALFVNDTGLIFGSDSHTTTTGTVTRGVMWTDVALVTGLLTDLVQSYQLELGLSNAIVTKLRNAVARWMDGHNAAAANQIRSFIDHVDSQRGKTLTDAQADRIINLAAPLAFALSNGVSQTNPS